MTCVMVLSVMLSAYAMDLPGSSLTKTLKVERAAKFEVGGKPFGDFWGEPKYAGNMTVVADAGPNGEVAAHFTGTGLDFFMPDPVNNYVGCDEISLDIKSTSDFTFSFNLDFKKSGLVKSTSSHTIASTNGQWKTVVVPMTAFISDEVRIEDINNMKQNFVDGQFEPAIRLIAAGNDAYVTNYKARGYEVGTAMSIAKTVSADYTDGKGRTLLGRWSGTPIPYDAESPTYNPKVSFLPNFSEDGTKNSLYIGGVPDDSKRRTSTNGVKNTYTYAGTNIQAPDNLVGFDYIRVKYASNKAITLFMYQKDEVTKFPNNKNERQSKGVSLPSTKSGADITIKDDRVWQTMDIPVDSFIQGEESIEWVRNMKGSNNGKSGSEFKFTPANCYRFEGMKWGVDDGTGSETKPGDNDKCRMDEGVVIERIDAIWVNKLPTFKSLTLNGSPDESCVALGENTLRATFETSSETEYKGGVFVAAMYNDDPDDSLPPMLVGVDLKVIDVPAGNIESVPYTLSLATPEDINDENAQQVYIKFMFWKDAETMDQLTQMGTIDLFGVKYQ